MNVICIETGAVYQSAASAARVIAGARGSKGISRAIRGGGTYRKMHFAVTDLPPTVADVKLPNYGKGNPRVATIYHLCPDCNVPISQCCWWSRGGPVPPEGAKTKIKPLKEKVKGSGQDRVTIYRTIVVECPNYRR